MRQITVLSGKGGTGKTTITAAFTVLAKSIVVADCDIDAPNLHMLLHPEILEKKEFRGSRMAAIDETKCVKCGICRERCRFGAITQDFTVDPFSCEGCGVCAIVCPVNAVTLTERVSGYVYISRIRYGFMVHALLKPGELNSGKLVTMVRQDARLLAEREGIGLIVIDGLPGIGCPAIASVTGVDAGLVVTEPTLSGIHDLERAIQLLRHFNVRPFVCVNMYDINADNTDRILKFCEKNDVEVVGKIPFNPVVTKAMVNGKAVIEYSPESDVAKEIVDMWRRLCSELSLEVTC
jgi:MinD superfamily P-loop ATPase